MDVIGSTEFQDSQRLILWPSIHILIDDQIPLWPDICTCLCFLNGLPLKLFTLEAVSPVASVAPKVWRAVDSTQCTGQPLKQFRCMQMALTTKKEARRRRMEKKHDDETKFYDSINISFGQLPQKSNEYGITHGCVRQCRLWQLKLRHQRCGWMGC